MASPFEQLVADAVAHHEAGRLDQAEAAYRDALRLSPGHAAVTHNLGVIAAARGRHREAIAHFDAAIAAEPQYATAHYNRASALQALGQSRDALQSFAHVCAIDPGHYDAHRALGFLWLAEGDRGRALDHFARTYELRRGDDRSGIAAKSLTWAARDKLLHDAEQFRYLAERRRDRLRFEALARNYEAVAEGVPEQGRAAVRRAARRARRGLQHRDPRRQRAGDRGPRGQRAAGPGRLDAALSANARPARSGSTTC